MRITATFVLASLITGCASTPWAIVDGEGASRADDKEYDIKILSVDGQAYFDERKQQKLDPGFHYLQLATTKESRRGDITYQPFALMAAPCVRYIVFAKHTQALTNKSWEVIVKKQEPIAGCTTEQDKKNADSTQPSKS